ncbi:MAG: beta-propeller fold lactonase family protein [Ignavibacteriae bacterium]|nr:beta-propeller fold lactonase family protein [Ignavibacteriota bacterium]
MKVVLCCTAVLLLIGCNANEVVIDGKLQQTGNYSAQIQPIFDRNCGGSSCHGGGPQGFAGGLDLTSHDGLMRGSRYGTVVVAGQPFMSHLIQSINPSDTTLSPISSVQMPAGRSPLVRSEIETIARWIRDGARNDAGELPFSEPRPLGKVFFTSQSVDLVGVLDRYTNLIMRYTSVGRSLPFTGVPESPHNVQIDNQGRYYYVTMIRGGKLRKYDAITHQLVGEASVPTSPAHVVLTNDGQKAYVTDFDASPTATGQIYAVNTATMSVIKTIRAGVFMKATHGARLSQDGRYLYAASNATDFLHVIRTDVDSVVLNIPLANDVPPIGSFVHRPYQVAVRNDDQFIYTALNGTGRISIIRRNGDTFSLYSDSIRVGNGPLQCEVTRNGRYLYVCNRGSGSVSVIDAQANLFLTTISSVGQQPHGIDISDDSHTVFVTCENVQASEPPHHPVAGSTTPGFLAIIDVASQSVVRRIEVGGFAAGVCVWPGKGN